MWLLRKSRIDFEDDGGVLKTAIHKPPMPFVALCLLFLNLPIIHSENHSSLFIMTHVINY